MNLLNKIKVLKRHFSKQLLISEYNRRIDNYNHKLKKILLLYYIPKDSFKASNWQDGFVKAMDLLSEDYEVIRVNIAENKPSVDYLNRFDFIISKSNWGWYVDKYLRFEIKGLKVPRGIVVSGVGTPPALRHQMFYDVIWHQTYWYKKQLEQHPNIKHAFGIDTDIMQKDLKTQKVYDWVSVGAFTGYKRYEKFINNITGIKIAIGETSYEDSPIIIKMLKDADIEVQPFMSYEQLRDYLNQSKQMYIPAKIEGGGERAILEARACGLNVKVEPDNPKLYELTHSPIWDHHHYKNQIESGIFSIINPIKLSNKPPFRLTSTSKFYAGKDSFHNGNFNVKGDEYVKTGNFCALGRNITLYTSNHDYNYLAIQGYFYNKYFNKKHPGEENNPPSKARSKGPIIIGNDVWIGDNVKILSGVKIGDGVSIGAGSIVTKDIPSYTIAGGIPAKNLKKRYPQETIDFLLKIKWWYWSDSKIKKNIHLFNTNLNELQGLDMLKETIV